ncbi:MAG: polyprenyl synthetase family protein [Treponemataceae bacterium]
MTDFWNDFTGIPDELERVQSLIRDSIRSENVAIRETLADLFNGDGKLLRPGILLIASRLGKPDAKKPIALAAALEMLHVATLVHDDVIDDSPIRRGMPAVHTRVGRKDAVLIGDYLLSRCFLLAAEYTTPANAVNLARAISVICTMEIEQDMDRYAAAPSVRNYLRKIMGKTALLFSLACHVGAVESKAPLRVCERLRRAGYDIGMAFQIIDDILDYTGTADTVRKPVGNDVRAGLVTLPLICALRRDDGVLASLVDTPERFRGADVSAVLSAVVDRGGIDESRAYARRYTERALQEISRLPKGEGRSMMEKVAGTLLDRNY